ncbi:MAG: hypothetical protein R3C19_12715 [Planctomycetaceae bacterium]
MISGTTTLFNWSLKADVKSVYPHIVRAGFAVFMLLSISMAYAGSLTGTGPGLRFFQSICFLNVLLISVSGISYFVSAVTEEKDAGTLSLLRLAGVTPLAIVLSKSTSRLIAALMLLLIQLPFTFLAITLGGVLREQIIAAYLALAAWMCLVANMALFCSVRCHTSGRAASLATTVLILFFLAGPILRAVIGLKGNAWINTAVVDVGTWLLNHQQQLSVTRRLDELLQATSPFQMLDAQFWMSLTGGTVLFVLSVLFFNRGSRPVDDYAQGKSARVRRFTVGRCWKLAVVWKDFLFFTGGRPFFIVKLIAYGTLVLGFVIFHRMENRSSDWWMSTDLAWICFLTLSAMLTVEVLLYSSGSLFQEVRQSTIATLTMLPSYTGTILLQKLAACLIALAPVVVWLAVVYVLARGTIERELSGTMVVWYVFMLALCSHLTVLLSLYTRWAALPLAILITAASNMCCPIVTMALFSLSDTVARSHGINLGIFIGAVLNLIWAWVFVLLPMEVEIVNRWIKLSRE